MLKKNVGYMFSEPYQRICKDLDHFLNPPQEEEEPSCNLSQENKDQVSPSSEYEEQSFFPSQEEAAKHTSPETL